MDTWKSYSPTKSDPWDLKKAGHLFRRAGFGATHAELTRAVADGPEKTIDRLLAGGPADVEYDQTCEFMASERSLPAGTPTRQLAAWWLYRLLHSPHPLKEKLTLFWHNHFATSHAKVTNARYMVGQYWTLNKHALGSFKDLLHAITLDPAMMVWLDTVESKKGKPNENYARELMELFSLGLGHYTEADIREAARAFTGYSLKSGKPNFNSKEHDAGEKSVFGKKKTYKSDEIVNLCLDQPACPKFIVNKLYQYFINEVEKPDKQIIEALAAEYKDSGFETGKLVSTILRSRIFFDAKNYRQRVKSPVEFAVGIVRALDGNVGPLPLSEALEGLGQVLFAPPSVKGWDGGEAWLNAQTLLFRQNLAYALTSTADNRFGRRCDPAEAAKKADFKNDDETLNYFLELFVQNDLPEASKDKLVQYLKSSKDFKAPPFWTSEDIENHRVRTLAHLILSLPEYQLS